MAFQFYGHNDINVLPSEAVLPENFMEMEQKQKKNFLSTHARRFAKSRTKALEIAVIILTNEIKRLSGTSTL
jgi:hypothetical protein